MPVRKEDLFTYTAILGIVKNAVQQVVPDFKGEQADTIVFNSLNTTIKERKNNKKEQNS